MDATDLARWQFAITTVYHFLFVPITIGMSLIVAVFHTAWVRTHNPQWMRLAKFFGKLFLINFALGLVTGIVQEFQFGMNWSDYSRFVGDIFGAPLAIEALLAFFLESTFLGLWIFGWGRLPEKLHADDDVARAHRHGAVGVLHPRRELLHAAPGRLHVQRRERARRADRLLRRADQQGPARHLPARHLRRLHGRRRRRHGRLAAGSCAARPSAPPTTRRTSPAPTPRCTARADAHRRRPHASSRPSASSSPATCRARS